MKEYNVFLYVWFLRVGCIRALWKSNIPWLLIFMFSKPYKAFKIRSIQIVSSDSTTIFPKNSKNFLRIFLTNIINKMNLLMNLR